MSGKPISEQHLDTFERIRQSDADGNECWFARQLARVLEYSEYRHFVAVIERAKEACRNSGHAAADDFEDILEMVDIGSDAKRQIANIRLYALIWSARKRVLKKPSSGCHPNA